MARTDVLFTGANPRHASFAESSDGRLFVATGTQPVQVWAGKGEFESTGVAAPLTAPTLSTAGAGDVILADTSYAAYVTYVTDTGIESSFSPVATIDIGTDTLGITYSAIPASPDDRVTARRLYRTTGAQARVVYLDATIADNTTTVHTSERTDEDLQTSTSFALLTDDYISTTQDNTTPPSHKPFLAWHLGRLWLGGEAIYSEGSAAVTAASTTVTGHGTAWTEAMIGRFLLIPGNDPIEIDDIDEPTQIMTLLTAFAGDTDLFSRYAIRPASADARNLYYSQTARPDYWPPYYALEVPDDGDEMTGLMPMTSFLYILKRRHVYRITVNTDPAKDGAIYLATSRGCVNDRCFALIGEDAVMLDEQGIHRFAGNQASTDVSLPIEDIFRGDSLFRNVNWGASQYFHCVHCPREMVVRFFVALRGDRLPRHAICYQYQLDSWWVEEFPGPVGASVRGAPGRTGASRTELESVFLGGAGSVVSVLGGSPLDGTTPDPRLRFTPLDASPLSVTAPGTLPSCAQASVAVVAGRGKGQTRVVADVDGSVLSLTRPWAVLPDTSSMIQVGGIPYRYETFQMLLAGSEDEGERSIRVRFRPRPGETAELYYYHDHDAEAVKAGSNVEPGDAAGVRSIAGEAARTLNLGKREGAAAVRFDGHLEGFTDGPQAIRIAIEGVSGDKPHSYNGLIVKGVVG